MLSHYDSFLFYFKSFSAMNKVNPMVTNELNHFETKKSKNYKDTYGNRVLLIKGSDKKGSPIYISVLRRLHYKRLRNQGSLHKRLHPKEAPYKKGSLAKIRLQLEFLITFPTKIKSLPCNYMQVYEKLFSFHFELSKFITNLLQKEY